MRTGHETAGTAADADAVDARRLAERKAEAAGEKARADSHMAESGGPAGLEPTRYGDWEKAGRCIDF